MKIVIAPDSFKENLTSLEVATELEAGFKRVWPEAEYVKVPMADGGEGTVQSLVAATGGKIVRAEVVGPMGQPVTASYGILGDGKTAVIEMAEASGLPLVPRDQRNPLLTTTYGTGQLVIDAVNRGIKEFIIGIGGSATNDAGVGFAQALGIEFRGADGQVIKEPLGGGRLKDVASINLATRHPALQGVVFKAACDVSNPLCGPKGASAVYGPQKGATPELVEILDQNLAHIAQVMARDHGIDVAERPGAGGGGGLGWGLLAFVNATLKSGIDLVVEATGLEAQMNGAFLAVTGEGRIDSQTPFGKTPAGVAKAAKRFGVPVIAVGGGLSDDAGEVFAHGIDGLEACTANPMPLDTALKNSRQYLQAAAERAARFIALGLRAGASASTGNGASDCECDDTSFTPDLNRPVKRPSRPKRIVGRTAGAVYLSSRLRNKDA